MKKLTAALLLSWSMLTLAADLQTTDETISPPITASSTVKGMVFVIPKSPESVQREIALMDRYQLIQYLYNLDKSKRPYLTPSRDTITVIHAVFGRMEPGTIVNTRWTVTRETMPAPYSENYNYRVENGDAQSPFVVLNSLFNMNPGSFVFETKVNGKIVASRTEKYKVGLNK